MATSLMSCPPLQVVSILNGDLPDEIKVWFLTLMLSLVHPDQGLNPDTQQVRRLAVGGW